MCDEWPKPQLPPWCPYVICFEPDFAKIFSAAGLLKSADLWQDALDTRDPASLGGYDYEKMGQIRCSVLTENTRESKVLVNWPASKCFSSVIELRLELTAVSYEDGRDGTTGVKRRPEFFIGPYSANEHCFGLIVQKSWWGGIKRVLKNVEGEPFEEWETDGDWHFGTVHLVFGLIPMWLICSTYHDRWRTIAPVRSEFDFRRSRVAQLTRDGWTVLPSNEEGLSSPERIEHRYMEIWHRPV